MSKEEFVELLKSKGHTVVMDTDGTPMVIHPEKQPTWRNVCRLRKECGYDGSVGWRKHGEKETV